MTFIKHDVWEKKYTSLQSYEVIQPRTTELFDQDTSTECNFWMCPVAPKTTHQMKSNIK